MTFSSLPWDNISPDIERFVINVRGSYAQEVISFLHNKVDNIDVFSIESDEGWFYDTSKLIRFINTKYLLISIISLLCFVFPFVYTVDDYYISIRSVIIIY